MSLMDLLEVPGILKYLFSREQIRIIEPNKYKIENMNIKF